MPNRKVALALLLVAALLAAPLPLGLLERRWPMLLASSQDAFHLVLFGALAWLVFNALRPRLRVPTALAVSSLLVFGFGVLMEGVQMATGRDASWTDVLNNACGALAGSLFATSRDARARSPGTWRVLLAVLGAALIAVPLLPTARVAAAYAGRAAQAPVLWRHDSPLLAPFAVWYEGRRPVLQLREIPLGATASGELTVTLRNPHPVAVELDVRVHGSPFRRHAPLAAQRVQLEPFSTKTVRLSCEQIRAGVPAGERTPPLVSLIAAQRTTSQAPLFSLEEVRGCGIRLTTSANAD